MAIALDGNYLVAGSRRLAVRQVTELVELHLARVERTRALEASGLQLRRASFAVEGLAEFIRGVCRWGSYAGIAGRVLNDNSLESIRDRFQEAVAALEAGGDLPGRTLEALQAVNRLRGLGRPSFASKHLRFLHPKLCPVLDSGVAANFDYPMSPAGYHRYSADCIGVARGLSKLGIENPMRAVDGEWFAADVDMAVFALIASWSPYASAITSGSRRRRESRHPE